MNKKLAFYLSCYTIFGFPMKKTLTLPQAIANRQNCFTMKKLYKLLLAVLVLTLPPHLYATTYNTIAIDGANTGWTADETFDSISHNGYTGTKHAYFTWDDEYIYIAVADSEADYNNMATFVYFDTDPSGTNGTTNAYAWGNNMNTAFNADYAIVWKNNFNADYIEVQQYDDSSAAWNRIASSTADYLYDGTDTLIKFAVTANSNYREIKIKRSQIGNPEAIKTCMFTEQQWNSSGNYRYMTWPSEGWTDANRSSGQTIPNYYGFLLEDHYSLDSSAYYNAAFTQWTGATDNNWSNAGNWDNGVPADTTLVIIPTASTVTVDAAGQQLFDLSLKTGSNVALSENTSLTVNGGFFNHAGAAGMLINSTATGNGSLIVKGYANDSVTANCYITDTVWHSFSTPVSGQTTTNLFLNHSPEVWLLQYNETTNDYTFISSLTQNLGDMQGWMLWLGGNTTHTFSFAGPLRTDTIGSADNMIRTSDTTGYNFVGNPYPSAIDWDTTGWIKTNLNNAIYVYNHSGTSSRWATYVNGAGVDGGSRYIAMNQGFFVQVTNGGSYPEYGTLQMTNAVCVHNTVQYFKKKAANNIGEIIRLQVSQDNLSDETVIRIHPDATLGFDAQWDAHKLVAFGGNSISIFSTDNNGMAINSVPPGTESIPIDFSGQNATQMTVSLTEVGHFEHVFLTDESAGITVDLKAEPYTFTYRSYLHHRFYIHFILTGLNEKPERTAMSTFGTKQHINIVNNNGKQINVTIYNLLGQKIKSFNTEGTTVQIAVVSNRYYLVKMQNESQTITKKVFVP